MKKYNIGLDIGTNSVGWAVTESGTQKIIRKGNKFLWGVRLFDDALTAKDRRVFRSTRRRYDRRRERIRLLQELFQSEINKVDPLFFEKLKQTKFCDDDKINKTLVFDNKKDIYNKYDTIYHLRKELQENEIDDIRYVYLAMHHIIKYRGNFLYTGDVNTDSIDIKSKLKELLEFLTDNYDIKKYEDDFDLDYDGFENAILEVTYNDRKEKIKEILKEYYDNNFISEFSKMISKKDFDIGKLLSIDNLNLKISFSKDYDETISNYEKNNDKVDEEILYTIDLLKELYDACFIKNILKGNFKKISDYMINKFNEHKYDLCLLKNELRNYRNIYNKVFRTKKELCLYDKYMSSKCTTDDFCKELQKLISNINISDELKEKIEKQTLLPKTNTTDNSAIPYQLNKNELINIIKKQVNKYPFLGEKLEDGTYKIVKLLEFKIPYYVGPLNNYNNDKFAWLERKKDNVKITPYNFDTIIDKEKTAEKFIKRMTSHCTYLLDEYALPNNSILYQEFKVLNELKQIKIESEEHKDRLSSKMINKIIEELFKKRSGTITDKIFKDYLKSTNEYGMYQELKITGYSALDKFSSNMASYIDFFGEDGIFKDTNYNEEDAEKIIEYITIFNDKSILESKVKKEFENINYTKVLNRKYTGWGNLSKKLLITPYYKDKSIIDLLYETDENFMQIINNDKYKFDDFINDNNKINKNTKLNYDLVNNIPTSPKAKRGIYQSLLVVDEIIKYIGYKPELISIEMSRENQKNGKRTKSRKDYLLDLYEEFKSSVKSLYDELKDTDEKELDSEKLYLYFIQEGQSMYSGERLDINKLSEYEVDHILPRSIVKDDSLDNKVLVIKEENQNKKNSLIVPESVRRNPNVIALWERLSNHKLLSNKKLYKLTRKEYKDEDISGFINRQIVETSQITKYVAHLIESLYESKVVYLKPSLAHSYRQKYEMYKFRDLNDYHHAHDAYLTSALGEYVTKVLRKSLKYNEAIELDKNLRNIKNYKDLKYGYVINSLDSNYNTKLIDSKLVDKNGEVLFDADLFNETIINNLYRNDILISRKTEIKTGEFYNQTLYKKGIGKFEIKKGMDPNKYGGYSSCLNSYYILISYYKKEQKTFRLIAIPYYYSKIYKDEFVLMDDYIRKEIKIKNDEQYFIEKKFIPFNTKILYENQYVYLVGYSGGCEVKNAVELKINKNDMIKWKYALNNIFNNAKLNISEDEFKNLCIEILNYLLTLDNYYPLFKNNNELVKNLVNNNYDLTVDDYKNIIKQIVSLYKYNKFDLSKYNDNLHKFSTCRLNGRSITHATIYNTSVTGLYEAKPYEF